MDMAALVYTCPALLQSVEMNQRDEKVPLPRITATLVGGCTIVTVPVRLTQQSFYMWTSSQFRGNTETDLFSSSLPQIGYSSNRRRQNLIG